MSSFKSFNFISLSLFNLFFSFVVLADTETRTYNGTSYTIDTLQIPSGSSYSGPYGQALFEAQPWWNDESLTRGLVDTFEQTPTGNFG